MDYKDWRNIYRKIVKDFDFSVKDDKKSAKILDELLKQKNNLLSLNYLKNLINGHQVFVFGAGPSLETSILKYKKKFVDKVKIAADGATTALLKNNILPDIIVTDLDGKISDQLRANSKGSIVIIHAHGDNIKKIRKYIPEFKGPLMGTTQVDPNSYQNLYNFGGFTDGDRGVYIADHFQPKEIYLAGFDFDNEIGRYSFAEKKDIKMKLKKLKWCKHLIIIINKNNIHFITNQLH